MTVLLPWLAIDSFSVSKTKLSNSVFLLKMELSRVNALSLREFLQKILESESRWRKITT